MKSLFFTENIFEILDYIDEGIHIIDNRGKIVYYNKFAQNLDNIDKDKVLGRHILEIYPSLSQDTSTLLKVIRTGEPIFKVEQSFINYKGNKISTVNTSIPIKANGKIIGALEISKDITQVRELSERIVDLQKELYKGGKSRPSRAKGSANFTFVDIIGQSEEMLKLKSLALKAAQSPSPVLVYGETGTGKELFVQAIHNASLRKTKPFIAQNCAALPHNLLEGILFGTVKGSFTGAEDRPGLFELANGGTLFLDEVNSMPMELQAKLLRVIQDGNIRRVGAIKTVSVDVRIIGATNVPPQEAVDTKQLRRDLYYRLNVISLGIPSLRMRKEDIPILVDHFIEKYNKTLRKSIKGVSSGVLGLFLRYSWPGNVRELEHVIEAAITLHDTDIIDMDHLPPQFSELIKDKGRIEVRSLKDTLEELERSIIIDALKETDWNISKTADLIDVPRQTLQYKIKKHDIRR